MNCETQETPQIPIHAYQWIGNDGGYKVGVPARVINAAYPYVLSRNALMQHAHAGPLEFVNVDHLYLYYGDLKHAEKVVR